MHRHHLDGRRQVLGRRLLLAQPGLSHGRHVAHEIAWRGVGLAAHVRAGKLAELRDVHEPLHRVGLRGEHLLAAQPDALDQPVDERVRPHLRERRRRRPVEAEEGLRAITSLGRQLRPVASGDHAGHHVEPAAARVLCEPGDVHRAQLDRWAGEGAHHGARVGRIGQQAQPGEHVAHLGALEVCGRAREPERHRALLQRGGDRLSLVAHAPDEHADLLRRHALLRHEPLALGRHRLRLSALRAAAPKCHCAAAPATQPLLDPLPTRCNHGAGRFEDRLAGAVALLEVYALAVLVLALEVQDVLARRGAEAMDRLVVIAGHRDVPVVLRQEPEQSALREVQLLVLVHQHMRAPLGHPGANVRLLVQEPEGVQHQIAEVERAGLGEQTVVVRVHLCELELTLGVRALGVTSLAARLRRPARPGAVVGRADHLVLQPVDPGDEAGEQRRRIATDLVAAQREVLDPVEHQGEPVRGGHRREKRIEPGLEGLVVEQARGEGMEGLNPEVLPRGADQVLHPLAHLGGGSRREHERDHAIGRSALLHEPGEAAGEHARLARARAAQDQQRSARMGHGLALRSG